MKISIHPVILGGIALLLTAASTPAKLSISGVFADHMVLQREVPVPIWGWADAGEKVIVEFAGEKETTTADADGKWLVKLSALKASAEPQELRISATAPDETIVISDVLVGDVWLCSGQSNMEFVMGQLKGTRYASDLTTANFPLIRHGTVQRNPSPAPINNAMVRWQDCTPATVGGFTAAGFYFARELTKDMGVPIGLLHSSWGGTAAESWTSESALDTVPDLKVRADNEIADMEKLPDQIKNFPAAQTAWEQANGRIDPGNVGEQNGWQKPDADTSDWQKTKLDAMWRDSGLTNGGIAWLRKEVNLPAMDAGRSFRFDLGLINEQYVTVYWNGEKIGESGKEPPAFYYGYVHFDVPPRLLKPGKNVFALRFVVDAPDKAPLAHGALQPEFSDLGVPNLGNECLVKVETEFPPITKSALAARPIVPKGDAAHTAGDLFNGMIYPLVPFAIKGALWYQGEADGHRAYAYRTILPLMIRDWRSHWGSNFPFIIQQLPNWTVNGQKNTDWAELREAQALTAKNVSNCGISVAIDIGEANNVHPKDKRDIGHRLALVALAKVYGQPIEFSGPVYSSMTVEGSSIRLKFDHADGLKSLNNQPLNNFTIAADDQKFVPAVAKIDGDSVLVSSPDIDKPVAVRYAFINNPENCNFSNASGLPAMPFRTDTWPGGTDQNK